MSRGSNGGDKILKKSQIKNFLRKSLFPSNRLTKNSSIFSFIPNTYPFLFFLSLFDRNNFSNERAIYDRGEIVMGN